MATPVAMTDAIPLMQAPPNQALGQNTANDLRRGLIQPLIAAVDPTTVREGVLCLYTYLGGVADLQFNARVTAGQGGRFNGGYCVINRDGEGPYLVFMTSGPTDFPLDTAPTTNPCYDTVGIRLYDKNISADNAAPLHGGYFDVIRGATGATLNLTGTPGSAGAPPIIPDSFLPVADVERAVGNNTITSANIKDRRRGTSLIGGVRPLLPGDKLADPGYSVGETRYRPAGFGGTTFPAMTDRWDGTAWRGTQEIVLAQPSPNSVDQLGGVTTHTLATITYPDPGWPHRLRVSGSCLITEGSGGTPSVSGIYGQFNIDDASFNPAAVGNRLIRFYGATSPLPNNLRGPSITTEPVTGGHTVFFLVRNDTVPSTYLDIVDNEYYHFDVSLVPA